MQTYGRIPVAFVRGEGTRGSGTARARSTWTSSAGSRSRRSATPTPRWPRRSPTRRARCCTSRTCTTTTVQPRLARTPRPPRSPPRPARPGRVFFANSGAEANECAIKLRPPVRPDRTAVRSASTCCRRTTRSTAARSRTLAATGQPQKQETFQPLPAGFRQVEFADLDALRRGDGRAGLRGPARGGAGRGRRAAGPARLPRGGPPACATSVRRCWSSTRCRPGSGGPAAGSGSSTAATSAPTSSRWRRRSATACRSARAGPARTVAAAFRPGDHATTFGGQPLAARAALAVLDVMEREDVPRRARRRRGAADQGVARTRRGQRRARRRPARRGRARARAWRPADGRDALPRRGLVVNAVTPDGAAVRAVAARDRRRDRCRGRDPARRCSRHDPRLPRGRRSQPGRARGGARHGRRGKGDARTRSRTCSPARASRSCSRSRRPGPACRARWRSLALGGHPVYDPARRDRHRHPRDRGGRRPHPRRRTAA